MPFHRLVRPAAAGICLLLVAAAPPLTPKEIADGWVQLFDGATTFGWKIDGDAAVTDGELVLGGGNATTATAAVTPAEYDLVLETDGVGKLAFTSPDGANATLGLSNQPTKFALKVRAGLSPGSESKLEVGPDRTVTRTGMQTTKGHSRLTIEVARGATVRVRSARLKPHAAEPLFDGKTLAGWKPFAGDAKREKSVFAVTPAGELSIKNGPGDLATEKQFGDFVLQLECKTLGPALNGGVFFRCLPGQYQQGYEAQIQNSFLGTDRTKPVDFGTGAIYRRVAARKVVANDTEWFTMTVLAKGPHIATWVNGDPTVSWTDDRKPAENARQGLYAKPGPISLQGHDPTTDLLFRNVRIAEIK